MATFLSIGSNVGDRLANLQRAVDLLEAEPGVRVVRSSRVFETDPVGGVAQADFLNAVLEIATNNLTPHDVLAACGRVELALGRTREIRWGPRTIDVDLLLIDDVKLDDEELTLPHPRMIERAFVLVPLLELWPDGRLPDGTSLLEIRSGPDAVGGVQPFAPPLRTAT